ncbi:MAG: DUF305 domain-containing protein [Actinomycetia bacterium]|nr:DUF305 domain-containing protein [Actinomycetes bacterium]
MSQVPARLAAALVAVATTVTIAACTTTADSTQSSPTAFGLSETPVITGAPAGYNADDVFFATTMVSDHQQTIEMSNLVAERTANPELAELAGRMAAAQQSEINIMNVFLVQWRENPEARTGPGGRHVGENEAKQGPDVPGMVDDATMETLKSLRGNEFDILWLTTMISHQQGAVEMARDEIANGTNVDAVAMARTIAARQEAEIEQMQQILEGSQP